MRGCLTRAGRDDATEGERRDAIPDLLLTYPNTTVTTYV
jgi:hypothetical protein